MAATVTGTSKYVEGGDQVRRFQITGDTAYPSNGYDIAAALKAIPGPPLVIRRVISIRHRTVASALLGLPVAVDTYTGGFVTGLKVALVQNGLEVSNGTNATTLNLELVTEGY